MMDTIQILYIIRKLPVLRRFFNGVFPIDKLKHINMQRKWACIVNTAPSTHKGEHWIAIIKVNRYPEFFDSYGLPPPLPIHNHLSSRFTHYKYNKKQVQGAFSTTCGAHCIYFLYKRALGETMKKITRHLNDKHVTRFIDNLYSPDEESDEDNPYTFQRGY